jgi:hypothetical protein
LQIACVTEINLTFLLLPKQQRWQVISAVGELKSAEVHVLKKHFFF